jgi:glyoxalase family protein
VLFEVATDHPGFTVDETVEQLGSDLRLPKFLESMREQIERALPTVRLPNGKTVGKRRPVDVE